MINLSALNSVTNAASALSNLVLVTPQATIGYQPQNPATGFVGLLNNLLQPTPPPLLFHYEGEQTVSLESDITDHYIEDNTAIQDQIALRPEIITTRGFIGELNNIPPKNLSILQNIASKLTTINAFTPPLTQTATNAYENAFSSYDAINRTANEAIGAWGSLTGNGATVINGSSITPVANQNKQQTAFQQFYGYWRARYLFTIQTPWAVFQNCAIYKLRAIQSEETRVITDFEVTFKLIRMSSTINSPFDLQAGRLNSQASPVTELGTSTPESVSSPTQLEALAGVR